MRCSSNKAVSNLTFSHWFMCLNLLILKLVVDFFPFIVFFLFTV